jgi:hypothetical protein
MFGTPPDDLEVEITKAKQKLDAFENGSTWRELTARLQASNRMHPFLLVRTMGVSGAMLSLTALLLVLMGSVFSRDVAEVIGSIESVVLVPMPILLGLLAVFLGVGGLLGWIGSISAGREAPYLPHEAKVHQRLLSDVQQLEAKRSVKERMTPKPATPRLLDRRGR